MWLQPDHDLRDSIDKAEGLEKDRPKLEIDVKDKRTSDALDRLVATVGEVMKHESERETNLNARGAAVASVAGVIVALSSAIGKTLFEADTWSGGWQQSIVGLFLFALVIVAVAMVVVVVGVLRPKRGPAAEIFPAQRLSQLWMQDEVTAVLTDEQKDPRLLYVDSSLRTLPRWHYRNRIKARWLRRSYVLLTFGVALIGVTGLFVLSDETDFPVLASLVIAAAAVFLAWEAIENNWVGAVTEREKGDDAEKPNSETIDPRDPFEPAGPDNSEPS
jgi:hypothetical protein